LLLNVMSCYHVINRRELPRRKSFGMFTVREVYKTFLSKAAKSAA
jgi:hypothetical protein